MSSIKDKPFSVVSVEEIEPLAGAIDGSWYRYILEWEHGTIVGTRCGTLQQVTSHAKDFIDDRNFRDETPGYSIWTRRRKK